VAQTDGTGDGRDLRAIGVHAADDVGLLGEPFGRRPAQAPPQRLPAARAAAWPAEQQPTADLGGTGVSPVPAELHRADAPPLCRTSCNSAARSCPGGAFENSPAIHRWDIGWQSPAGSPEGTVERDNRSTSSTVPTGLSNCYVAHLPSSELLGYSQSSLRDGETHVKLFGTTADALWGSPRAASRNAVMGLLPLAPAARNQAQPAAVSAVGPTARAVDALLQSSPAELPAADIQWLGDLAASDRARRDQSGPATAADSLDRLLASTWRP